MGLSICIAYIYDFNTTFLGFWHGFMFGHRFFVLWHTCCHIKFGTWMYHHRTIVTYIHDLCLWPWPLNDMWVAGLPLASLTNSVYLVAWFSHFKKFHQKPNRDRVICGQLNGYNLSKASLVLWCTWTCLFTPGN